MIPHYLYQKDILKLVDSLIMDDGYECYGQLSSSHQSELTLAAMRSLGDDASLVFTDPDDADSILKELMRFLRSGSYLNACDLANAIRKNAVSYFASNLEDLFHERLDYVAVDRMLEDGLVPIQDRTNGETRWIR